MTHAYRLKNAEVKAVQYTGQEIEDLPDFAKNFECYSPLNGLNKVGRTLTGSLMVPHPAGYYTATNGTPSTGGDWLVLRDNQLFVVNPKKFADVYEPAPEPEALTLKIDATEARKAVDDAIAQIKADTSGVAELTDTGEGSTGRVDDYKPSYTPADDGSSESSSSD